MTDRKILRLVLSSLLVCLVICFIFSNSLQNGEESSRYSGMVTRLLRSIFDPHGTTDEETFHYFVRKGAHFSEFALLGFSLWLLMQSIRSKYCVSCPGSMLFAALAAAVTDEFIQSFTGRTSSVTDVLIDFGGALTGFVLPLVLFAIIKQSKEKNHAAKECGIE